MFKMFLDKMLSAKSMKEIEDIVFGEGGADEAYEAKEITKDEYKLIWKLMGKLDSYYISLGNK